MKERNKHQALCRNTQGGLGNGETTTEAQKALTMQTPSKKEPLQIRVVCKDCRATQNYTGTPQCSHCKTGSVQLLK